MAASGAVNATTAQRAAQKCGHRSIDAPHLLLGLLRRTDTKGCQALNHAGLTYLDVLIAVQEMGEQTVEASGGRSGDQRMAALERADKIRAARAAQAPASLGARVDPPNPALPPAYVETAKVADLLLAMPSSGRVKVHRLLTRCGISSHKTFGGCHRASATS